MKYSNEDRKKLIAQWRAGSLSRPEFCQGEGVNYQTFMSWFKSGASQIAENNAGSFIELSSKSSDFGSNRATQITLPNGVLIALNGKLSAGLLKLLANV